MLVPDVKTTILSTENPINDEEEAINEEIISSSDTKEGKLADVSGKKKKKKKSISITSLTLFV